MIEKTKDQWRQEYHGTSPVADGKIAQALRRLDEYHHSKQVFVEPTPALAQVRINALLDGKDLIVPGPGLRDGFYCLKPFVVPFPKLSFAVSLKGMPVYGQLLRHHDLPHLDIGVMVAGALAVDESGVRLGDGSGFFDLSCAILNYCHGLNEATILLAAAVPHRPKLLPADSWDVRVDGVLGPQGLELFQKKEKLPAIDWQQLPMQRIKKITPLWEEWKRLHPSTEESIVVTNT